MKNRLILIAILIFFALILSSLFIYKSFLSKSSKRTEQSTTLNPLSKIPMPLMSFPGKIAQINGNILLVTQTNFGQPFSLQVRVTAKTLISRPPITIPFLFPNNVTVESAKKLSLSDLKVGKEIISYSNIDVRLLKVNDQFEANQILVEPPVNTIFGTITKIKDNVISLKGFPPNPSASLQTTSLHENDYSITVRSTTEISRLEKDGQPGKFNFSNLKVGNYINVFSRVDTRSTFSFDALRIEPYEPAPPPVPTFGVK